VERVGGGTGFFYLPFLTNIHKSTDWFIGTVGNCFRIFGTIPYALIEL